MLNYTVSDYTEEMDEILVDKFTGIEYKVIHDIEEGVYYLLDEEAYGKEERYEGGTFMFTSRIDFFIYNPDVEHSGRFEISYAPDYNGKFPTAVIYP